MKDFTQPTSPQFVCVSNLPKEGPCTNAPVLGTAYCARHNGQAAGSTAKKRAKAAERYAGKAFLMLVEAGVEERVTILQDVRRVDPGELLLDEVARCAAIVRWLEQKISSMSEEELIWEKTEAETVEDKEARGGLGESYSLTKHERNTEISRYWRLLESERKLLTRACEAALRSNIEERRVRLAERQVSSLEAAVTAALLDLGLDPHSERVRQVVGRRLGEALGEPLPVAAERVDGSGTANYGAVPPPAPAEF